MAPFRVALSSDFMTASGEPAYPMFDLAPLTAAGVEYEYVECVPGAAGSGEALTVPAASVEGFDALILLAATFTAESIPSDGRLKCEALLCSLAAALPAQQRHSRPPLHLVRYSPSYACD